MKIPSLKYLIRKSKSSLIRFPFSLFVSILGTITAIYVIDFDYTNYTDYSNLYHLIMTCSIGLPMFLAITIFSERLEVTKILKFVIRSSGFIFLLFYYLSLPDVMLGKNMVRFVIYLISFNAVVSFSPFIGFEKHNAFWQFNKSLFLRLLLTSLYAGVLYTGISLAILAVDKLFGVDIREEWYFRLWVFIVGIFSVWFFLSGIPKYFDKLEGIHIYPKGIKIFTQYILLPIVTVYAIILYVYFIKVLITRDWPVGWVVYLVSGYSFLGIFSFLLLYPIYNIEQNKGVRLFTKIFFYSIFPLLIMFFIAISKRISEYGFTENRIFIVLTGIWLFFISIYLIITKYKKIRMVPVSIVIIAFLSVSGPWNVFKISKWSQKQRLENILIKNNLFKDGTVVKTTKTIDTKDDVEICSILTYFADMHGYKSMQPLFKQNLDTIFETDSLRYYTSYNGVKKLTEIMGIEYNIYEPYYDVVQYSFSCQSYENEIPMQVTGYDYLLKYRSYYYNNKETDNNDTIISMEFKLNDSLKIKFSLAPKLGSMSVLQPDTMINFNVFELMNKLYKNKKDGNYGYYQADKKDMTIFLNSSGVSFKIVFTLLSGNITNKKFSLIQDVQADILVSNNK